jgi:protein-S-isoprenylcysteine O-methyltransferase Ste14
MKRRIKIQGFLIFVSGILSVFLFKFLFPSWKTGFPDRFFDYLGIILALFGFLFRISARGYKSEKSGQGRSLVKAGPYALTRNPMYLGTFLICSGFICLLFNWWVFPIFLVIFLLIYIPETRVEEEKLKAQFGQAYISYCQQTPRCFPQLYRLCTLDMRSYLPLKWSWIKKEYLSLIGAIGAIAALEAWEDIRLFGLSEYLRELLALAVIIILFLVFCSYLTQRKSD